MANYTVFIDDLEFYGFHGASREEQKVGHRYIASVHAEVEGGAPETDLVADTVDYGMIAKVVIELGTGPSFTTVERLAHQVAQRLLGDFDSIEEVEVSIAKMAPPMPVIAATAGVVYRLSRHG